MEVKDLMKSAKSAELHIDFKDMELSVECKGSVDGIGTALVLALAGVRHEGEKSEFAVWSACHAMIEEIEEANPDLRKLGEDAGVGKSFKVIGHATSEFLQK